MSLKQPLSQPEASSPLEEKFVHEKAKLICSSAVSLSKAGKRLREGGLVSFPTETVYGLGCHALDPSAIAKVFAAKERPLTDPLIAHVTNPQSALDLWHASSSSNDDNSNVEAQLLSLLTKKFWPGPLTLVAKANPKVPQTLMANTGFVACRSPSHSIARALIDHSGVPIAAPSANKFGHVSPTRAKHVWDDLNEEDVWIVDPELDSNETMNEDYVDSRVGEDTGVCQVGVESTVAKIEMISPSNGIVTILRHGAISAKNISDCLALETNQETLKNAFVVQEKMQSTNETVSHVAPGQTIRHYSPNVMSYIIAHGRYEGSIVSEHTSLDSSLTEEEKIRLKTAVIIDWGGRLNSIRSHGLAYRDVSPSGDSAEAAASIFETLRWSETIEGAERVYFPEIQVKEGHEQEALVLAVKDRLTRAASGVVVDTFI